MWKEKQTKQNIDKQTNYSQSIAFKFVSTKINNCVLVTYFSGRIARPSWSLLGTMVINIKENDLFWKHQGKCMGCCQAITGVATMPKYLIKMSLGLTEA